MDFLTIPMHSLGFPCGSAGKESAYNAGDLGLIPGLGRSPGEGKGYPLQCSSLENSMDCIFHGVPKGRTQLSNFHFHFHAFIGASLTVRLEKNLPAMQTPVFLGFPCVLS